MKSPLYLAMVETHVLLVTTILQSYVSSSFAAEFRWAMRVEIDFCPISMSGDILIFIFWKAPVPLIHREIDNTL
ncbi:hypothetical protein BGX38DRAFT_287171 [Terfezia claveryi]|nr:hypothetical protein BGX38DRAFT_287171 [Terfezia claveryi]